MSFAELQAEVHALKQRQLIHETELWLKKEELDLQFKRDQLKLETEFKKAVARESAYAKADSERNMRVASSSLTSSVPRTDLHAAAISNVFSGDLKQESSAVFHGANFRPEEHKTKHKVPSQSSSDSDEQSGLSDQAFHILEQQNHVMEEFVNQQQKGRKEDQNRSQRDVNQKSLLSDESSGVEHVCNLTTTEGSATALPIVPVKVSAQEVPFASRPTPS